MASIWYAAFALLAIATGTTAVLLVAVMRQVGVLHQRVQPTGPGTHEGPQAGWELPLVRLEPVSADPAVRPFDVRVSVLAYITPGCALCAALPDAVRALLRHVDDPDVMMAFITDTPLESARHYVEEMDLPAALFHSDGLSRSWDLPGSPYVLAIEVISSTAVRVLACGVVNTLEQFEDLVDVAVGQVGVEDRGDGALPEGDGWEQGRVTVFQGATASPVIVDAETEREGS
jgi:hypothetical protein